MSTSVQDQEKKVRNGELKADNERKVTSGERERASLNRHLFVGVTIRMAIKTTVPN